RPREWVGGRRAYPVRRGDQSGRARPPRPRLARQGIAAHHHIERGALLLSLEDRRLPRAEHPHAAADEQPRLLFRAPRQPVLLALRGSWKALWSGRSQRLPWW